jgi:hypothetical protein
LAACTSTKYVVPVVRLPIVHAVVGAVTFLKHEPRLLVGRANGSATLVDTITSSYKMVGPRFLGVTNVTVSDWASGVAEVPLK